MNSSHSNIRKFLPWIIILLIVAAFDFIKVLPRTMEWIDAQEEINSMTQEIAQMKSALTKNEDKKIDIQAQFDAESKDFVQEEGQVFPKEFSPYDVSKIFELFSIQHSLIGLDSMLRIESLSFSGGNDGKAGVTLNVVCTEDTLKRIIKYLQSGNLPEDFIDNGDLDAVDIEYLLSNKLPIAHIKSLRVSSGEEVMGIDLKRIALDISFFIQS